MDKLSNIDVVESLSLFNVRGLNMKNWLESVYSDRTIGFVSNPKFRETYFKKVMNPMENDGVDFWWIDWQQGTGDKDDERLVRWIEYGVFSPIMRLHSSNSEFLNKEPWEIAEPFQSVIKKFLRLRHALLPYTYTETYRAYKDDKPLIRPMYYEFHDAEASYHVPNEYGFGESLIVGAITEPEDRKIKLASVNMYIPEGRWYCTNVLGIFKKWYR